MPKAGCEAGTGKGGAELPGAGIFAAQRSGREDPSLAAWPALTAAMTPPFFLVFFFRCYAHESETGARIFKKKWTAMAAIVGQDD